MSNDKAPMTYNPRGDNSSSDEEDDLIIRKRRRERLNMLGAIMVGVRDQMEADHELTEKLQEEERLRGPSSLEVPSDANYAHCLQ